MSTLATTNIKHPSSASNNIVLDASGNVVLQAGSASTPALQPSGDTNTGIFFPAADTIAFAEGGVESARIDSSGRLLVGTSTARTDFFNGGFGARVLSERAGGLNGSYAHYAAVNNENNDEGAIILLGKSRGTTLGSVTVVQSGDALGTIEFEGADGTDLVPAARIQAFVDGTPGNNDLPTRLVFSTTADGASSPTERMRINNVGRINCFDAGGAGFRFSSASAAGTSDNVFSGFHSGTSTTSEGTVSVRIYTNGNIQNTNNSYGSLSDIKLKENIVDAASQWNDLKALQVRKYNFKEETGQETHTQIGLVAQEVELVSPGLVSESPDRDEDGNDLGTVTKSVNYSVLYMKAVKALQEAMERIEQLETEMVAVKAQLS